MTGITVDNLLYSLLLAMQLITFLALAYQGFRA
jgi:hypothetical protein